MISAPFLSGLSRVLNHALAQDPEILPQLDALQDKHIHLHLIDLDKHFAILFDQQKIILSNLIPQDDDIADLHISGRSLALLKLGRDPEVLFSADITIKGDIQFAKTLQDLLTNFDFDWEQQLAQLTGDTLAHPIANGIQSFHRWASQTTHDFTLDIADYLREESRILPDASEVNTFMKGVDKIRGDMDRLAARVQRLQAKS